MSGLISKPSSQTTNLDSVFSGLDLRVSSLVIDSGRQFVSKAKLELGEYSSRRPVRGDRSGETEKFERLVAVSTN